MSDVINKPKVKGTGAREYWRQVIEAAEASGMPITRYCREHNITVSAFYRWRKVFRGDDAFQEAHVSKFIQVGLAQELSGKIQMDLGGGVQLLFEHEPDVSWLKAVVKELRS